MVGLLPRPPVRLPPVVLDRVTAGWGSTKWGWGHFLVRGFLVRLSHMSSAGLSDSTNEKSQCNATKLKWSHCPPSNSETSEHTGVFSDHSKVLEGKQVIASVLWHHGLNSKVGGHFFLNIFKALMSKIISFCYFKLK